VRDVETTSAKLLNDLQGYAELQRAVGEVLRDLKEYHTDQFDNWTRDVGAAINSKTLRLHMYCYDCYAPVNSSSRKGNVYSTVLVKAPTIHMVVFKTNCI
jgi:uncharacterized protein (DUF934 family)